ncbi:glycosyltransferase family 2 protein [Sulfolobus tengchongensis]|uniref:Glycosyltransferase family 2 protein n=1 Tax=Sulfolobus tengchongensis TaxID=207809 RepID=A0AAX4L1W6_9CREN
MSMLSIIVVNVKGKENLPRLLSSLDKSTFKDFELIVVDTQDINGNFKLVKIEKDLGLAYCRNKGVEASQGKFLLFLDNDTELMVDTLENFIKFIQQNPNYIVQLKLIGDNKKIDAAGGLIDDLGYPFELFKGHNPDEVNSIFYVTYAKGAAIGMSREIFEQLQGFDIEYFYGYDETDFCLRAIKKGNKVVFLPTATVFHHEHGSFSKSLVEREKRLAYYLESRRLYFVFKNFNYKFLIRRLPKLLYYFFGSIFMDIFLRRKFYLASSRIRALAWVVLKSYKIFSIRIKNRRTFVYNEDYLTKKGLIIKHGDRKPIVTNILSERQSQA